MDSNAPVLRILPGQWRPQYPCEQIAWLSPPWVNPDHIWLDFPEALFIDGEMIYLGHVDDRFPAAYTELPAAPWECVDGGIRFERQLPNGLHFTGQLTPADGAAIAMEFSFTNHSNAPMRNIHLQTCAYLRQIREFADYSHENIFVHTAGDGWVKMNYALEHPRDDGSFLLGWREGSRTCDWPVVACASTEADRSVAMTWFDHTLSLIGNPDHPCFHADPFINNLQPGASHTLTGVLAFFTGDLGDLDFGRDLEPYRKPNA